MNKDRVIRYATIIAFALGVVCFLWPWYRGQIPLYRDSQEAIISEIQQLAPEAPLQLITEPDQGLGSITTAIKQAQKSIDLVIYSLSDEAVEQALIDAQARGLSVRVILDHTSHFGKRPNEQAYDFLNSHGVGVHWAPTYFPITHQKTFIIDDTQAIVMTFNLTPQYYASGRDFAIINNDANDVQAIEQAFDADWQGSGESANNGDDLVWSPGSADTLLALINTASTSLDIYNEEMADRRVTEALKSAGARGVQVRATMTYASNWKSVFTELSNAGVEIHTFAAKAPIYIHAKVIIADNQRMFVGSENFSQQSLNLNRELGILIARPEIISSIKKTFDQDWSSARPFGVPTQTTQKSSTKKSKSTSKPKTPTAPSIPITATTIKLSTGGICHTPGDPFYDRTVHFEAYPDLASCISAGGRAAAGAKP